MKKINKKENYQYTGRKLPIHRQMGAGRISLWQTVVYSEEKISEE